MSRKLACGLALGLALTGCSSERRLPAEGDWHAWLDSPGGPLPFRLVVSSGPRATIVNGQGKMPPFKHLDDSKIKALIDYLKSL